MRIVLVVSSLRMGGTERVVSLMANYWAERGREVVILTFAGCDVRPFFQLSPSVRLWPLGITSEAASLLDGLLANFHRLRVVRSKVSSLGPDVVISFGDRTNVVALLATRRLGIPTILSERTDPISYDPGAVWRRLRDWSYLRADALVVQSAAARDYFASALVRSVAIPNPVIPPAPPDPSNASDVPTLTRPVIVTMGRLSGEKGYDLLLRAFGHLRNRFPEWRLAIAGDGPLRNELQAQIDSLGLRGSTMLVGRVRNTAALLRQADLFAMSSRFEGFPNAVCEAMACGVPVVSFDCPAGPREIIRHGIDGILVPAEDVDALSDGLGRLMGDEVERRRLGRRATEVVERFSMEKVMSTWEELLRGVMA